MFLVQILLPLYDQEGRPFARSLLEEVREELTHRFGGATAWLRAPASGAWKDDGKVERDDVVLVDVQVEQLDRLWWATYRRKLEHRFEQDEVLIRATVIERL